MKATTLVLAMLLLAAPAEAAFDEALYGQLLERHTRAVPDTAGTRVDYRALRSSPEWKRVVKSLDGARPDALASKDAKLAFWINAYNVLAIDVVLGGYPLDSIKDRGGFITPVWRIDAGRVGGTMRTLHEIEHEILRPMGDPRIHAAIVCASTSCPSLRREPFRAATVDAQLDDALRTFLADTRKGLAIDRDAKRVTLSSIFDWFAEDFGGAAKVLTYLTPYAPEQDQAWLRANARGARVAYFDYDWRLNDTARAR